MRRFTARLLNFLRLRRPDGDLAREIEAHLALMQDEFERRGMSRDEARRAARLSLGGVEQTKAGHRDARSFVWLEDARQDLAHGLRLLRRSPVFTVTAALSLAIGIGANTAVFAVANALLFHPPDGIVSTADLVDIGRSRGDGGLNPIPYATYLAIARQSTSLSGVFAQSLSTSVMSLVTSETATVERIVGQRVTTNFFAVLGSSPAAGRVFESSDDDAVVVLDHGFWVRRFNGDPGVVGSVLRINGRPVTVVGVAAAGFQGTGIQTRDVWFAIRADAKNVATVVAGGRLRPGQSVGAAAAEVAVLGAAFEREQGVTNQIPLNALPFSRAGGNRNVVAGFAAALMTIVSLMLAVACANVAGILLARSAARSREMALRTALGAGRGRLVRQLLTETLTLCLIGGGLGLVLARATVVLTPLLPTLPAPIAIPLTLDWRVWLFALSLSLVAALTAGLAPAFKGSKVDLLTALKADSRSASSRSRLRGALVVVQIALSILLVVIAGLFVRAVRYAGAANPGFDPRGVEIAAVDLSMAGGDASMHGTLWRNAIERVRDIPAVASASLARVPPGGFEGISLGGIAAADRAASSELFFPGWNVVDTGYFTTLRIPLITGRDFSSSDVAGAPPVAIVGDTVARRLWPGQDAVGKFLAVSEFNPRTRKTETKDVLVVGVVGDIKSSSFIDGLAESYVYLPLEQSGETGMTTAMTIVARGRGGQRVGPAIGAAVRDVNPNLVLVRSETVEDSVALGLAPQRLIVAIAGSLGLVGLLLTSIGIYGVIAYTVARRRQEFGIRMALGAPRARILWMVLRQGFVLLGVGAAIGLGLAAGVGQLLSVFLYGLPAIHVPTLLVTTLLLIAVGATACYVPARSAMKAEPLRALRRD